MHSKIGAAIQYLRREGFRPAASPKGHRYFDGDLHCAAGAVPVRIKIADWEFATFPVIEVRKRPAFLPPFLPHLLGTNGLCYFASRSIVLDRYYPDVAIAQCLAQARDVLDQLASDPQYRQEEFEREFDATWALGQLPMPDPILLGEVNNTAATAPIHFLDGRSLAYVTSHASELERFCSARGWTSKSKAMSCWLIRTGCRPMLPEHAMPSTVSDMFCWLRTWSKDVYLRVQEILGDPAYLAAPRVVFLVRTPVGWFGFGIELDPVKSIAYRRRVTRYRQYLHNNGNSIPITRYSVTDVGSDFIHNRNLSHASLKDRCVTVIGCGAIGGYVAHALAKLGAGSGETGELRLVDHDVLGPGNLGRHYLGMNHLFAHKADALAADLTKQFPALRVQSVRRSTDYSSDISGDLVVNATGEESLSEALNYYHLKLPEKKRPPMLHVWVLGNGQCTQAIWVERRKFACYRCLCLPGAERKPRFEVLDAPPTTRVLGCTAFTPYAVSAPMSAAALAVDMVVGWLEGNPGPRFRTRAVEGKNVQRLKNQDLSPLNGCPGCSATSSA